MNRTETFKAMSSRNRIMRLLEIGAKEISGTITAEDIADREAIQEIRFKNGEMEAVVKEWERDPEYHGPETAKVAAKFREEQARRKTREELERMEAAMRALPAPEQDKAVSINAIHALLATMPEATHEH